MHAQFLLQCSPGLNKLLVARTVVKSMPNAEIEMFVAWFLLLIPLLFKGW